MTQGILPAVLFLFSVVSVSSQVERPLETAASGIKAALTIVHSDDIRSGYSDSDDAKPDKLSGWLGLPVREIAFEGLQQDRLKPLSDHLPQAIGEPLDREKVAQSLRQLFATGLFETIEASASREGDG